MPPLDAAGAAAMRAEFATTHGRFVLRAEVQAAVVAVLVGEGVPVAEIDLDVTWDDVSTWETVWHATLDDAGISGARDKARFTQWAKARSPDPDRVIAAAPGSDNSRPADAVGRVITRLEGSGVVISEAAKAELRKDFEDSQKGDYLSQSCCAIAVWIIYLGRMPKEDEITWWNREYRLSGGSTGGKIDIARADGYIKMHTKTADGEVITLARALKSESRFREWVVVTTDALTKAGLPLAAVQLTKVLLQAEQQSYGSWAVKSNYLHSYFFSEYLGVGMPQVTAFNSAIKAMGLGIQLSSKPRQMQLGGGALLEELAPPSDTGGCWTTPACAARLIPIACCFSCAKSLRYSRRTSLRSSR